MAPLQFFTGTPMPRGSYTAQEFHSSAQSALGLPQSRLKSVLGRPITNNSSCPTARVDAYGYSLKTVTGVKYDGARQLHDLLANQLSKWLRRAKIPHMGGAGVFKRICKGLFTEFANNSKSSTPTTLPMPRP